MVEMLDGSTSLGYDQKTLWLESLLNVVVALRPAQGVAGRSVSSRPTERRAGILRNHLCKISPVSSRVSQAGPSKLSLAPWVDALF